MTYSLKREGDGAGDSGPMSELLQRGPAGDLISKQGKPEVGFCVRVGSLIARSYQAQDYWMTTTVLEILEDRGTSVRFRTANSVYIWTCDSV